MPYEHQFKMIIDGLANISADLVKWANHLDLRIDAMGLGASKRFSPAVHAAPPPRTVNQYRDMKDSLQHAAELLLDDANCMEGMVEHISTSLKLSPPLKPHVPDSADHILGKTVAEPDLIHLILGWQHLDLELLKTILKLYGLTPASHPLASHPGVSNDKRLCEEIVSWLKVISADLNTFTKNHGFPKSSGKLLIANPSSIRESLLNFEHQYHRLVEAYLLLLTVLPYHLKRANP